MTAFQIGDQVRLKSGGPVMTVSGTVTTQGTYQCRWFDTSHAAASFAEYFHPDTLHKFEEPDADAIRKKIGLTGTN
ncbi:YodC family protein [Aeromonas sp. NJAU223]|uniref:YodC family protein n=1 Tax=Aeromonas sp. NJAU223 TaxID=3115650 RepID=UPI003DA8F05E